VNGIAGCLEHLQRGAGVLGLEVPVEGVDEKHDFFSAYRASAMSG
jgi:hypothetical protein